MASTLWPSRAASLKQTLPVGLLPWGHCTFTLGSPCSFCPQWMLPSGVWCYGAAGERGCPAALEGPEAGSPR